MDSAWWAQLSTTALTLVSVVAGAALNHYFGFRKERQIRIEQDKQRLLGRLMGLGYATTDLNLVDYGNVIDQYYYEDRQLFVAPEGHADLKEKWEQLHLSRSKMQAELIQNTKELLEVLGELKGIYHKNSKITAAINEACKAILEIGVVPSRTFKIQRARWASLVPGGTKDPEGLKLLEQWRQEQFHQAREFLESQCHGPVKRVVNLLM